MSRDLQAPFSQHLFKLVIVGDSGVGKSCLLLRFADDTFSDTYITTIGVDFRFKTINIDGRSVKLQIWDTAGQERFRTITSAYYRGADGVMLVFDKTSRDSLEHIPDWITEIEKYSNCRCRLLVGNKDDDAEHIQVDYEAGKQFADSLGMQYIETSALNAHQVEAAFAEITKEFIKNKSGGRDSGTRLTTSIVKEKVGCCNRS